MLHFRVLRPLAPILLRMLNGDDTARMLGLDVRHHFAVVLLHRAIAATLRAIQRVLSPFANVWQPMAPIAAWFGKQIIDEVVRATDSGRMRHVEIPAGWR